MVKHHQTKGKIKVSDWLQYTSEGAQVTSGIMNFGMMGQNVYSTASFNYNSYQISKYPAPVHGNSLKTTKPAQGYILTSRLDGSIQKYGETTMGFKRYTNKFLNTRIEGGLDMKMVKEGTKKEMHDW